jgi:hypothetical protein
MGFWFYLIFQASLCDLEMHPYNTTIRHSFHGLKICLGVEISFSKTKHLIRMPVQLNFDSSTLSIY